MAIIYKSNLDKDSLGILSSKKDQYLDIDLQFNRNPVTNDVVIKRDVSAINQSLRNLLLTNYFERSFFPKFGGNLYNVLFENADQIQLLNIRDEVKLVIETYEKRVTLVDVVVEVSENDENSIDVTVIYTTPTTTEEVTLEFTIERVR